MKTASKTIPLAVTYGQQPGAQAHPVELTTWRQSCHNSSFMKMLRDFTRQNAVENGHTPKTLSKYSCMCENFATFLESSGRPSLSLQEYNLAILREFIAWLPLNLKSCNQTHLSKHVYRINKAVDDAVNSGLLPFNPTRSFKIRRGRNKRPVSIHDREYLTWINAVWNVPLYQQAQDLSTLQAEAGLSYIDLYCHQTYTDDKGLWMSGTRTKTGMPYHIPLWHPDFERALRIHEKYQGKLPYIANATYNRVIKEMAGILGIQQYFITHLFRKRFATNKKHQGWATPPLSNMLGNTEKVCRESYEEPGKENIISEIKRLENPATLQMILQLLTNPQTP